jgi:hypothetical protein
MRKSLTLAAVFVIACAWMRAQVLPEATGPIVLSSNNIFSYSLRYSQAVYLYGSNVTSEGNQGASIASGSINYQHAGGRHPFTADYTAGYEWSDFGADLGTGIFQRAFITQEFIAGRWKVSLDDGFGDIPEAPTIGFSGVPGTGEPTGGTGAPTASSVLTINTREINNLADGKLGYQLSRATTFEIGGGSEILNFPDGGGLNSTGELANVGMSHQLNSRNSVTGDFDYSHFSYGASPYSENIAGSFNSLSLPFGFRHVWSPRFTTTASVGPQWLTGSASVLVPTTTGVAAAATAVYLLKAESFTAIYERGTSGGSGYLPGAVIDTVSGYFTRFLGRATTFEINGSYIRYSSLLNGVGDSNARYGGVQVTRRLGRDLNFFGDYNVIDQASNFTSSAPQGNLLNSLYSVISFGIGFSPRESLQNQ